MKKNLLIVLVFCSFFLLNSCSGPAPAAITDISELRAEIDIYQSLSDNKDNSVSVILYDKKGKEAGNNSITVWVNQKKADYQVMQHLYYSQHYYYRIEDIQPENNQYTLEIQLKNGKKFFLGNAPTLAQSNSGSIICTRQASLNKDFPIRWSHLYNVNLLYISKSFQIKNQDDNTTHYFIEEPTDTLHIKEDGNYLIKKEKLFNPGKKLSAIYFKFTAQKMGKTNTLLLKGSSIKISGYHETRVSFQ
ncbi:MAG: hypothetical protein MUW56_06870 [Chryseobacterium sp.]|uniref:hypothetical protein n=1 Tax=Chryseobacterium sp. TaxID=1871047 RepID=UPI0025BE44DF|nr:hypothetical protein [Chryseobacterium sp.]MCJ7933355.1 hypothetical protein [Chryseobacterium sp.]